MRKSREKQLEEQFSHLSDDEYQALLRRHRIVPLAKVDIALEAGDEATIAEYLALSPVPDHETILRLAGQGDMATLSDYLNRTPGPNSTTIQRLARMLDPGLNGDPDWQLVFRRRRAGNPVAADEAMMNLIWVGNEAIERYESLIRDGHNSRGLWKRVRGEIGDKHRLKDRTVLKAIAEVRALRRAK
ncbi:hypothetical protein [Microvirga puerhi]|uniref:Uncharacterized protein n=1 Tax=Microvirga puerhi TaxID=2876078 RepID=A0ABS7VWD3_9HYPH|nr:hypothetical protein [Microvirga puerhi]MBZ6079178.1 hypothetical protein [Microvirga puerhi]